MGEPGSPTPPAAGKQGLRGRSPPREHVHPVGVQREPHGWLMVFEYITPLSPAQAGFASHNRGLMVFEQLLRYSPRRRASHPIAEGFSPTTSPA